MFVYVLCMHACMNVCVCMYVGVEAYAGVCLKVSDRPGQAKGLKEGEGVIPLSRMMLRNLRAHGEGRGLHNLGRCSSLPCMTRSCKPLNNKESSSS